MKHRFVKSIQPLVGFCTDPAMFARCSPKLMLHYLHTTALKCTPWSSSQTNGMGMEDFCSINTGVKVYVSIAQKGDYMHTDLRKMYLIDPRDPLSPCNVAVQQFRQSPRVHIPMICYSEDSEKYVSVDRDLWPMSIYVYLLALSDSK